MRLADRDVRKAIAMAAVSLAAVSCSGSSGNTTRAGPQIGVPGGQTNDSRLTLREIPTGQLHTIGGLKICAEDTTRPIRIAAVSTLSGSQNLVVADFGTRPNPFIENKEALGEHAGTASSLGFHSQSAAVCGPPIKGPGGTGGRLAATTELAVTLQSTAPIGQTPGFAVSYSEAGKTRSFVLHFGVTLCSAAATQVHTAECDG